MALDLVKLKETRQMEDRQLLSNSPVLSPQLHACTELEMTEIPKRDATSSRNVIASYMLQRSSVTKSKPFSYLL